VESEIEPETMRLQAVGGLMRSLLRKRLTACLLHNDPASYSSAARLSVFDAEPQRKRVRNGRPVAGGRPEAYVIYPWPG
jgi:hypothetical protein